MPDILGSSIKFGHPICAPSQSGAQFLEACNTNQVKEYIVDHVELNNVLLQYKNVFNSELGTLKNVEVKKKTKPDVIPKFCKAHLLPYTLADGV